jgi:predicted Zn-dependent protease
MEFLKGYLIDYRNARKMKMDPTGSAEDNLINIHQLQE